MNKTFVILLLSIVASHHHAVTHHMAVRIISLMPWHFVFVFHVLTLVVVSTSELDSIFSNCQMLSCPEGCCYVMTIFQIPKTLCISTVSQRQHVVDVLVPSEGVMLPVDRFCMAWAPSLVPQTYSYVDKHHIPPLYVYPPVKC